MASPTPSISVEPSPANNYVSVVARPTTVNPKPPMFLPNNTSPHYSYFSPPPIYFFSDTNLPPPPSIFVYYPLWFINPSPNNRFDSIKELPPLYSPNPSLELPRQPTSRKRGFGRRSYGLGKKVTWRRKIEHQVESNGDHITTVMLRNIPNKYTREMMIEFMDKHCEEANEKENNDESPISAYDFLYLPIDFRSEMNKGYEFVNYTNAKAVSKFKAACNHKPWCRFSSRKVLEIANARIQGKDELVKHFERMTYPVETYSAVSFSPARSGPKNAVQTITVGKCNRPMISV